jgi:hypothetical protein
MIRKYTAAWFGLMLIAVVNGAVREARSPAVHGDPSHPVLVLRPAGHSKKRIAAAPENVLQRRGEPLFYSGSSPI